MKILSCLKPWFLGVFQNFDSATLEVIPRNSKTTVQGTTYKGVAMK